MIVGCWNVGTFVVVGKWQISSCRDACCCGIVVVGMFVRCWQLCRWIGLIVVVGVIVVVGK